MPAIMTHHQFGVSVLYRRGAGSFPTRDERAAFFLGNQGPDPFFFATRTPALVKSKRFGSLLHKERVDASLNAMLFVLRNLSGADYSILAAYISGYLCHFSLDSATHPYIFAVEQALCEAGIQGLDERDASFVHAQIESDIDSFLLWYYLGKTIADLRIARYALQGNKRVLALVDALFASVASDAYGLRLPSKLYARSVKDMRMVYGLIQSPTGTMRSALGSIERTIPGRRHSLLQALSPRFDVHDDGTFLNTDHQIWIHPFTRKHQSDSFIELFCAAADDANARIDQVCNGCSEAYALTAGLSFDGSSA